MQLPLPVIYIRSYSSAKEPFMMFPNNARPQYAHKLRFYFAL